MIEDRFVLPEYEENQDMELDVTLRPKTFSEYIGQENQRKFRYIYKYKKQEMNL